MFLKSENKKFADVATGTAKVEFSDVSSQAKDMIETIDNACNTDRTSRRNSQTETLKLLTSDMAVETMPFTINYLSFRRWRDARGPTKRDSERTNER